MVRNYIKKQTGVIIKKTIIGFFAGVFLITSTVSWAKEERLFSTAIENKSFSSRPADNTKLAAGLRTRRTDFKERYKAASICRLIEKEGLSIAQNAVYDITALKEIIDCLTKGSVHPIIAAEIGRLIKERPDQKIVSNAGEYIPGPFRIKDIRNVRIVENGQNLFADYRQHVLNRVQNVLDLINKKAEDGSLLISEKELIFFNKYLKQAVGSLFNSDQVGDLTYPQFEELLFVLVNMITPALYDDIKKESNSRGMKIYTHARNEIKDLEENKGWNEALKRAVIYAALGNGLEAKYYDKSLLSMANVDERLINIDGFLKGMLEKIETQRHGTILYFLDNAGEIFTDLLVVELLLEKGFNVKLAAKESATTDDLTVTDTAAVLAELKALNEEEYSWLEKIEITSSGARTPATDFNKVKPELFEDTVFAIYKGGGEPLWCLPCGACK